MRHYSFLDRLLISFDESARLWSELYEQSKTKTDMHITHTDDESLTAKERKHSAGLMRVNHAGELAAQGLYQGQALTAHQPATAAHLHETAHDEKQHLQWCSQRLRELDDRPSLLSPLWYGGSFAIGCLAGLAGDRWSLGFIKETEDQVVAHLSEHLQRVPSQDQRTIDVLERIKADELEHANEAQAIGAKELPQPIKSLMANTAKVMTKSAYYF